MKILQVITRGDTFYGAQSHVLDLCRLLRDQGQEVTAIVGSEGPLTQRMKVSGVPYEVLPSMRRAIRPLEDLRCVGELHSRIAHHRADLVASHSSKAGILTRMASDRAGVANVFTAHGWSFEDNVPWWKRRMYLSIERRTPLADHFIAVSDLGKSLALRHRLMNEDRISTVHYGVADVGGKRQRRLPDIFTMTMVAGLRPQKDHATLIRALTRLRDRPWRLNLLGDGPLRGQISEQLRAAGLLDRVHMPGAVDDVAGYLDRTHVKILTTHYEGLPISILECLSFGMPIIASDVSGVREEVIDGYNGILVPHEDAAAVAEAITRLMDRPAAADAMGRCGRQLFEDRFGWNTMRDKTLEVYRRAADHRRQHRVAA